MPTTTTSRQVRDRVRFGFWVLMPGKNGSPAEIVRRKRDWIPVPERKLDLFAGPFSEHLAAVRFVEDRIKETSSTRSER